MRRRILLILIAAIPVWFQTTWADATPTVFSCLETEPTEVRPKKPVDPFPSDASLHHENGLWVTIPHDGIIDLLPEDAIAFGPLAGWRSTTVTWLRDEGVEGFVEVSGQRLDKESEFAPQTPLSPQRQYVRVGPVTTGLAFPSEGCWEVVGSADEREIAWIVEVHFSSDIVATPFPQP